MSEPAKNQASETPKTQASQPFQQPTLDDDQTYKIAAAKAGFDEGFTLYGVAPFKCTDGEVRYGAVQARVSKTGKILAWQGAFQLENEKEFANDNLKKCLSLGEGVRY